MKINDIIKAASDAYDVDNVVAECWDFRRAAAKPRAKRALVSDTLAEFVAVELQDVYDEDASTCERLGTAAEVMERAARQLLDVANALRALPCEDTPCNG